MQGPGPGDRQTSRIPVGPWGHLSADPSSDLQGRRPEEEAAAAQDRCQQWIAAASPSSFSDARRLSIEAAAALRQSGWEEEEEGHVQSEAASAARYLTWLEDRWQLRLSTTPHPPAAAAVAAASELSPAAQRVLQELLRAEGRFIREYGLSALEREVGFFAQ